MRWYELTVHTTEEAMEMVTNFLHEMGASGVSIEESSTAYQRRNASSGQWYELPHNHIPEGEAKIKGYFSDSVQINEIVQNLDQSIQGLKQYEIDIGPASIDIKEVKEEDWANQWKQYYKPVRISDRLIVKPTWESYEAEPDELVIELDPGMAFGTGTHETTVLCLRTIEQVIQPGDLVIDVGTGSGILAIAAVKLGAGHVLALDLDPVAVSSARENARVNRLENQITVLESDLLGVIHKDHGQLPIQPPVQLVVANILAETIVQFIDDVYEVLETGGTYIASGIIKNKESLVVQGLIDSGFTIDQRFYENDWVAIVARKL